MIWTPCRLTPKGSERIAARRSRRLVGGVNRAEPPFHPLLNPRGEVRSGIFRPAPSAVRAARFAGVCRPCWGRGSLIVGFYKGTAPPALAQFQFLRALRVRLEKAVTHRS